MDQILKQIEYVYQLFGGSRDAGPYHARVMAALKARIPIPSPRLLRLLATVMINEGAKTSRDTLTAASIVCASYGERGMLDWVRTNIDDLLVIVHATARDLHCDRLRLAVSSARTLGSLLTAPPGRVTRLLSRSTRDRVAVARIRRRLARQLAADIHGDRLLGTGRANGQHTWLLGPPTDAALDIDRLVIPVAVVAEDGRPTVAIAYDVDEDLFDWAVRGDGAYRFGDPRYVSGALPAGAPRPLAEHPQIRVWMPDALEPTAGSFLDAARLIAAGTWHALVVDAVDPAALAVADLLVTEAGGRVTDSLGRPLKHIGVVSHGSIAISNAIDHEHVLRWTH